ncbi:MAG: ribbon-helix-helix domain-containing protein [Acidimicrobiales bacterium]
MSKQLTVRLPDDLVDFIDRRVEEGKAPSRAAAIATAMERERREEVAERDAAILSRATDGDDLDALAAFAARAPMDDLA